MKNGLSRFWASNWMTRVAVVPSGVMRGDSVVARQDRGRPPVRPSGARTSVRDMPFPEPSVQVLSRCPDRSTPGRYPGRWKRMAGSLERAKFDESQDTTCS